MLTLGLLMILLTLVWWVLAGPLMLLSYVWLEAARLRYWVPVNFVRLAVALVGLPLAVITQLYVALIPSGGDMEGRAAKLNLCWVWPFSWDLWRAMSEGFVEWAESATPERQAELQAAARTARLVGFSL